MARKGSGLGDVFGQFADEEIKPVNTKNIKKENPKSKSETPPPTTTNEMKTIEDVKNAFKQEFEAKTQKKTVEQTHTRTTFLFRNDLQDRLDTLAKDAPRGFKTMFMNRAIEALLNEWDD